MFFLYTEAPTPDIYTLSLHDALPISGPAPQVAAAVALAADLTAQAASTTPTPSPEVAKIRLRSEEHTSELQSRPHLVCRLLLEKKNASDSHCGAPSFIAVELSRCHAG